MANGKDAAQSGPTGFLSALRKKLYDNAVASVAAIIGTGLTAAALFVWQPLKTKVEDRFTAQRNITSQEALRVARSIVGSRTLFAVPFRNRDDDSQYIAVWYETDARNDPCDGGNGDDDNKSKGQAWCAQMLGPYAVDLLIGGQGTYERRPTHITAGTQAGGIPADQATIAQTAGKPMQRYWGIIDRDGDGKKEILSIANQAGTAATLPTFVSLYETATGKVRQLRSYPSRFSVKSEFSGVESGSDRAWLIARLHEFEKDSGDQCERTTTGVLSCTESEQFKKDKAEDEKIEASYDTDDKWMMTSDDNWVAENGVDFTEGKIKLEWSNGRLKPGENCTGRTGKYEWVNVFKGPLVVNDLASHRRSVAYLQDGDHHREIPAIVFGKRYVWLALTVDKSILAIDPQTFELKHFYVREFAKGIPQSWLEQGKPLEMVSQQELAATKDYQLDGLALEDGHLSYADIPLTVSVPADEFADARICPAQ